MAKITVTYFRRLYDQFMHEKITISNMVEKLNEQAERTDKCKSCKRELDGTELRETGLCTACFTSNA